MRNCSNLTIGNWYSEVDKKKKKNFTNFTFVEYVESSNCP